MKKIFTFLAVVLLTANVFLPQQAGAQTPEKMSYQAVIRNSSDVLVTNTQIGMEINIRQGSPSGTVVYTETLTPTTNANGLVSIEIGGGTGFNGLDWSAGPYFIETKTDITGGTTYTITGTSQLLSVPYALHAKTAESISGGIIETDPIFGSSVAGGITGTDTAYWNNKLDSYTETDPVFGASVASGITATDTTYWNNKLDSYTETDPIFGSSVASGITGTDTAYWNNKLDSFTETDPVFGSSVASGITGTDTANWNNKLDTEVDGSITNEIQILTISNDTIYLSNGGFAKLPAGFDGQYSSLSGTPTKVSSFTNDSGYLTSFTEVDGNTTNEIQSISRTGLTVTLSNGGGTYTDSVNVYTAGTGINITNNVVSAKNNFYLGQDTLGGIVYYIYLDANGNEHGLIVSKTETTAKWQNTAVTTNATLSWDGVYNMNLMNDSPAKNWVASNFSAEWYLPSIDEISLLWHARFHVNKAMDNGGFTELSKIGWYWSSTEYNSTVGWFYDFTFGHTGYYDKTTIHQVRAIRAF